jgi:hypothetical protein
MYTCVRRTGDGFFERVCTPSNTTAHLHDPPPLPSIREWCRAGVTAPLERRCEQERWSHERQRIVNDSPGTGNGTNELEHERRKKFGQKREGAREPQPPQVAYSERPHRDRAKAKINGRINSVIVTSACSLDCASRAQRDA